MRVGINSENGHEYFGRKFGRATVAVNPAYTRACLQTKRDRYKNVIEITGAEEPKIFTLARVKSRQ